MSEATQIPVAQVRRLLLASSLSRGVEKDLEPAQVNSISFRIVNRESILEIYQRRRRSLGDRDVRAANIDQLLQTLDGIAAKDVLMTVIEKPRRTAAIWLSIDGAVLLGTITSALPEDARSAQKN